jgi:hypothetical protein
MNRLRQNMEMKIIDFRAYAVTRLRQALKVDDDQHPKRQATLAAYIPDFNRDRPGPDKVSQNVVGNGYLLWEELLAGACANNVALAP